MKLKPLPEFIDEIERVTKERQISYRRACELIFNRVEFGRRKLEEGMFYPVSNGQVLSVPDSDDVKYDIVVSNEGDVEFDYSYYQHDLNVYYEALDKVLFAGFTSCDRGTVGCLQKDSVHLLRRIWEGKTIEDLFDKCSDLILTETAEREIMLNQ